MRKAIANAPQEFTTLDILSLAHSVSHADKRPQRYTVTSAVWKIAGDLIKSGKLKIKQKGQGRRPTIYEKLQ